MDPLVPFLYRRHAWVIDRERLVDNHDIVSYRDISALCTTEENVDVEYYGTIRTVTMYRLKRTYLLRRDSSPRGWARSAELEN